MSVLVGKLVALCVHMSCHVRCATASYRGTPDSGSGAGACSVLEVVLAGGRDGDGGTWAPPTADTPPATDLEVVSI